MSSRVIRARLALGAAATFAFASIGHVAGMPGYWCLVLLLVGVLLAPIDIAAGRPGRYVIWRAVSVAVTGVWLACAVTWTPWTLPAFGTWLCGTITLVMLTPVMSRPSAGMTAIERAFSGPRVDWKDRIQRLAKLDVTITDVEQWANGHGYTAHGVFPPGGATWEDLAARARAFASDMRLPDGCAIEVDQGEHQGAFEIAVTTRDAFSGSKHPIGHPSYDPETDVLPMPMPKPGPLADFAPLGVEAGGKIAGVSGLRQQSTLFAGAVGSGKSGAAQTLVCWHTMRTDQVTYIVDLSAGRLGLPFMDPYLDGIVDKPAIDGLADTADRAEALLTWLAEVAADRPRAHRELMRRTHSDKLPISAEVPAIRVVFDEPNTIFANPRLMALTAKIIELQETTRAMAVRFDFTTLSGTAANLPTQLKKQIARRFALAANDLAEVAYVLDWTSAKALNYRALSRRPGMAYTRSTEGGAAPHLMRFWRVLPSGEYPVDVPYETGTIYQVATKSAAIRPNVDAAATRLPSYSAIADRWDWQRHTAPKQPEPQRELITVASRPDDSIGEFNAAQQAITDIHAKIKARIAEQESTADPATPAVDPVATAITSYMRGRGDVATGEIQAHIQEDESLWHKGQPLTRQTIQSRVSELADRGAITKTGHGRYTA